ncbi:hypothetical protein [Streptomyces sp. NBC_00986]|uniref:hypothetical protein n=1 Tax=Streptomyces sp. NBC_00986 TaxID=2903702 RepID=UPI003863067B|nr:hypothetical protein OG504_17625 [Streptomyces sp. NBC_00986]
MYALIVPASTPFVLLATVLGLSWWEDHILPTPAPTPLPQLLGADAPLTETPPTPTSPAAHPENDARSPAPPRPRQGTA